MLYIPIKKQVIEKANTLYDFYNIKNSITHGKGQICGAIGEILVAEFYEGHEICTDSTKDYDMIIDGHKIDVKTKNTTVRPRPFFLCSIEETQKHQMCDFYFFVRCLKSLKGAWLLGYISKDQFFHKSKFVREGERDVNGFIFRANNYVLPISELVPFKGSSEY